MNFTADQVKHPENEIFEFVKWNFENHQLTITLNRPEKKNALHPTMVAELEFLATFAFYNKNVWCVILDAAGDVFCSGADLKAFAGMADPAKVSTIPGPMGEVLMGEIFPKICKPVIAKVHGNVFAGGFLLICGCTYVFGVDKVQLGLPEVKRGIWPMQVMASLSTVMSQRALMDLCIRGRVLNAQEALNCGILTHVVTQETLDSSVNDLANEICKQSPSAIRLGMKAFRHMNNLPEHEKHSYLKGVLGELLNSKDAKEGLAAYMEKREPIWVGE